MDQRTLIMGVSAAAVAIGLGIYHLIPTRDELLADWSPDYREQCASFGEEAEFIGSNGVRESAERIRDYLNRSPIGRATDQQIVARDLAFCFGEAISEFSDVAKHPRTEAYLINNDLTDEAIALEILKSKIGKNARGLVSNNSQLTPEDALAWSRIGAAHKDIAGVHQLFLTASESTSSSFWGVVLEDERYGHLAQSFTEAFNENYDVNEGLHAAFSTSLNLRTDDANAARTFMQWYEPELDDRTILVPTACMDFEGNVTVCMTTDTIPPPEGTGQHALTAEVLTELGTHLFTENERPIQYINAKQADELVSSEELRSIPTSLISDFRSIEKRAEEIGGGYSASGKGSFGLTFGARPAFTF